MAAIWVSFRTAERTINNLGAGDRRAALVEAVQDSGTTFWDRTTSFIIVDTNLSVAALAAIVKAEIEPSVDLALVRSMDSKGAVIVGSNDDNDIFALMPYLIRG